MLPQGFTRVEWIEGNGDAYLGTGFIANQDSRIVMDFKSNRSTGGWPIFGSRASSVSRTFTFGSTGTNNAWLSGYNNGSINSGIIEDSYRHVVDKNKNNCYLDGALIAQANYGAFTTPGEVRIFKFYSADNDDAAFASLRVWASQFYDNGAIVRDYFGYIDENGTVNLWDDINLTPATRYGTFYAGPALIPSALHGLSKQETVNSVFLEWEPSEYANRYVVARNGIQIADVYGDITSYADNDIAAGITYEYTITPYNGTQSGTGATITAKRLLPEAPTGVIVTVNEGDAIVSWEAVPDADRYIIYKDGDKIAEVSEIIYRDINFNAPSAAVYTIRAKVGESISDPSSPVRAEAWGEVLPNLIYDRTQADVNDAKTLISKYMRGEVMDGYEQEMWDRGLRGCYNTTDVNRVEYHTRELQIILNKNGYNIHIDTALWAKSDIMRYSDIVRYLGNIKSILDAFGRSSNAPPLPTIEQWIDYIAANDIEKILFVTRELVYGAIAMFRRAGTFTAGNDYLLQIIRRA